MKYGKTGRAIIRLVRDCWPRRPKHWKSRWCATVGLAGDEGVSVAKRDLRDLRDEKVFAG